MARDTDTLLARLQQFVPDSHLPLEPIHAGIAAVLGEAERFAENAAAASLWGGAEGIWLSLHARSQGTRRRGGESDEDLVVRLQTTGEALTPVSIVEGVRELMRNYTLTPPLLIEWWDTPYLDWAYLGDDPTSRLSGGPHSFLIVLPASIGEAGWGDAHLGDSYLGWSYLGIEEADVIGVIAQQVAARKAAGVRAWLVVLTS